MLLFFFTILNGNQRSERTFVPFSLNCISSSEFYKDNYWVHTYSAISNAMTNSSNTISLLLEEAESYCSLISFVKFLIYSQSNQSLEKMRENRSTHCTCKVVFTSMHNYKSLDLLALLVKLTGKVLLIILLHSVF